MHQSKAHPNLTFISFSEALIQTRNLGRGAAQHKLLTDRVAPNLRACPTVSLLQLQQLDHVKSPIIPNHHFIKGSPDMKTFLIHPVSWVIEAGHTFEFPLLLLRKQRDSSLDVRFKLKRRRRPFGVETSMNVETERFALPFLPDFLLPRSLEQQRMSTGCSSPSGAFRDL